MKKHIFKLLIFKMILPTLKNSISTKISWFLLFLGVAIFSSCQSEFSHANKGVSKINVTHIKKNIKVELSGEWEFYWQKLWTPDSFLVKNNTKETAKNAIQYIKNPRSWTSLQDKNNNTYPAYGYATYRLQIELSDTINTLGFIIPKIWSANKIWVNGKIVSKRGKIATNFEQYENEILENIVKIDLQENTKKFEIIVQVANYDIFIAGIIQNFFVGNYENILAKKNISNAIDIAWLGFLYFMAIYHLILWLFHKDNSTFLFGVICVVIATRILVFGEHYLYQYLKEHNGLSYEWQSKAYFITSFLLLPFALLYVQSLYKKHTNKRIVFSVLFISLAYCIFILVAPPRIFTQTINIFEFISLLSELYLVYILILATFFNQDKNQKYDHNNHKNNHQEDHKKEIKENIFDAPLQLIAIIFMIIASINDALHAEEVELFGSVELVPTAFSLLVALQVIIIARRFSSAFLEVEQLTKDLEKRVLERTFQLEEANKEVEKQKDALEDRNKQITDSIIYAERIQKAILPLYESIEEHISQYFILFQPRDIVSGDFYYFEEINQKIIIACVDCTGHGVPGALMSMLGKDILDNIILEKQITDSDKILNELHKGIRTVLRQHEGTNKDGMDITLLVIDKENELVSVSGAKNPLIYIQNNEIIEIKANRFSIGGEQQEKERIFDKHIIPFSAIMPDTMFYMFSDGYQDQFGGIQNKKFMIKNLKELFLQIHKKTPQTQHDLLKTNIKDWIKEGQEKQIDDILVMGIRLPTSK